MLFFYILEEFNMIWDWNISRKSFLAKLRPKGRRSRHMTAGHSDTGGRVEAWGISVPSRRSIQNKHLELGKSMFPPGNESRQSVTGYRKRSLRGVWKRK